MTAIMTTIDNKPMSPQPAMCRTTHGAGRHRGLIAAAVAAILAQPPAALALSLGPLELHSHLGEPLRAAIALGVGASERVTPSCIQLRTDATAGARPAVHYDARMHIGAASSGLRLGIDGRAPLREPLLDLLVTVNCPGVPIFERSYLLLLTPAAVAEQRADAPRETTPQRSTRPAVPPARDAGRTTAPGAAGARAAEATPASSTRARPERSSLSVGQRYRVRPGDTLSTIAQRVTDRNATLWAQATAIHAANPGAFIANDPDRIRAGALIDIPAVAAGTSRAASATERTSPSTASAAATAPQPAPRSVPPAAAVVGRSTAVPTDSAVTAASPLEAQAAQTATAPAPPPAIAPVEPVAEHVVATTPATAGPAADTPAAETFAGPPLPARLTAPQAATDPASARRADAVADAPADGGGVMRWLAGILVGLGFVSLGGLLAWTALRRRADTADDTAAQPAPRRTQLAPPPSFDPELSSAVASQGPADADATDEFEVPAPTGEAALAEQAAPEIDLDTLFPDAPGAESGAESQAGINIEATGAFHVPQRSGDTTVEHQFDGFDDSQSLDQQMAEAMAMLERDYTNRFEVAASLDDSGRLEATDTLHGLPDEIDQSLHDLHAMAEADEPANERHGHDDDEALLLEPTALLQPAADDDAADAHEADHTADQRPPKAQTG